MTGGPFQRMVGLVAAAIRISRQARLVISTWVL